MLEEKNLSKEFRETIAEAKALTMTAVVENLSVFTEMSAEDLATSVKYVKLLDRLTTLCCDMFEKQDKLMDKMDKAMDKYLAN